MAEAHFSWVRSFFCCIIDQCSHIIGTNVLVYGVLLMQMLHELHRYLKIGDMVELMYVDRANNITRRKVKIVAVDGDYVHVFCYSRRAPRIFLVANILAVSPPTKHRKRLYK